MTDEKPPAAEMLWKAQRKSSVKSDTEKLSLRLSEDFRKNYAPIQKQSHVVKVEHQPKHQAGIIPLSSCALLPNVFLTEIIRKAWKHRRAFSVNVHFNAYYNRYYYVHVALVMYSFSWFLVITTLPKMFIWAIPHKANNSNNKKKKIINNVKQKFEYRILLKHLNWVPRSWFKGEKSIPPRPWVKGVPQT